MVCVLSYFQNRIFYIPFLCSLSRINIRPALALFSKFFQIHHSILVKFRLLLIYKQIAFYATPFGHKDANPHPPLTLFYGLLVVFLGSVCCSKSPATNSHELIELVPNI